MTSIDWDSLRATVSGHLDAGGVPGAVLAVSHRGDVRIEGLGTTATDGARALAGDAVFRISSMTKPLVAVLTLMLVEDGTLVPHAPIERWVPELAGRRVLRGPGAPLADTVPADRPVTVADLLTMRLGFGFFFDSPSPVQDRAIADGLGMGPPDPSLPLTPDEWVARFAALPLMHQPGADWMYEFSFAVLGVVLARAAGHPLDALLRERVLTPLGMADTGFEVPASARRRLIPCYTPGEHGLAVFDSAEDSRWNHRPVFPDARGGLVSTASDYLRFARMLLAGGVHDGTRLLSEESVQAMTTDQLGPQRAKSTAAGIFLSAGASWGYGVEVHADRYGWGGGLGTTWYSYPGADTAAVLLTQCLPPPEALVNAFWSAMGEQVAG
jgi:CubicO group peptidase (beta-lactamase class C family)